MADIRGIFKSVWRNLRASNADILLVTGKLINAKTTLALAAATDYAAEDVMAASDALAWRFKNVVEREGGSGIIIGSKALCGTTALPLWLTLFLFEATPTVLYSVLGSITISAFSILTSFLCIKTSRNHPVRIQPPS